MVRYLIEEFKKELQRGTFNTSALTRFKNILEVHRIKKLDNSQLTGIRGIFGFSVLKVINNINPDELDSFFQFVNFNYKDNV